MGTLYTADEVRSLEERAVIRGVSTRQLMEHAGVELARVASSLAGPNSRFFIVCGPGNNGGDGLVAARLLAGEGRQVHVELLADRAKLPAEAASSLRSLEQAGVSPLTAGELPPEPGEEDVVIDAIFGTGLNRAPVGERAEAIERIMRWRALGAKVVAADVPSGVQSDAARLFEPCVHADITVAFGVLKPAHALEPAREVCGEVRCVDIDLQEPLGVAELAQLSEDEVRAWLPRRRPQGHKGTYGHLLVVAGSFGKSGAAALGAKGAFRTGVGLVTVAARSEVIPSVLAHAPEVMGLSLQRGGALSPSDVALVLEAARERSAVVLGPGIPRDESTHAFLAELLGALEVPLLIDADGLNALAQDVSILGRARGPVVLTPHPGEMARLLGVDVPELLKDRLGLARSFAREHGVTLVLKGASTLVAHRDGKVRVNPTGNPGMGTAGTGDVLSGVIGALLAGGLEPLQAASAGVYVHGLAGDLAAARVGQRGLNASDLFDGLGQVWARWKL